VQHRDSNRKDIDKEGTVIIDSIHWKLCSLREKGKIKHLINLFFLFQKKYLEITPTTINSHVMCYVLEYLKKGTGI
jgi:hypothetical protein